MVGGNTSSSVGDFARRCILVCLRGCCCECQLGKGAYALHVLARVCVAWSIVMLVGSLSSSLFIPSLVTLHSQPPWDNKCSAQLALHSTHQLSSLGVCLFASCVVLTLLFPCACWSPCAFVEGVLT